MRGAIWNTFRKNCSSLFFQFPTPVGTREYQLLKIDVEVKAFTQFGQLRVLIGHVDELLGSSIRPLSRLYLIDTGLHLNIKVFEVSTQKV